MGAIGVEDGGIGVDLALFGGWRKFGQAATAG